ncbi:MAG TPA: phage terminase small subunit P27 family [Anaerolineae bacterium]|nr:phage terminase small subunit P27 family [Anaerolineae bacterium]
MKGRKPKPTVLKKLAGNPGKRPLNEGEPQFPRFKRAPSPPEHLSEEAKTEWRRVVRMLMDAGLFTAADRAALALYCEAWGRWVEAQRMVAKSGQVITTQSGNLIQNPYLGVANRAWEDLRKILAEFGLTPSSRSRLNASPVVEEESLADILFAGVETVSADGG